MRSFALKLAVREGRAGLQRVGMFTAAIALGVGALTGLHAFHQDAADGVRSEARTLMGGDLRLQSGAPLSEGVTLVLDSLKGEGYRVSRSISLASSVTPPGGGGARLLQLNGVDSAFPLAGGVSSREAGGWDRVLEGGWVAADVRTLQELGVTAGDSLSLGTKRVGVAGGVTGLPVDLGIQTVVGPPLFTSIETLEESGLLGFGSLAQFRAFLLLPEGEDPARVQRFLTRRLSEEGVSVRTAQSEAESLAEGFRSLTNFLGLVGLMALLLGGIGVASAIHGYVRERIASIAVLRCLGARQGTVFRAYLLQALGLGLVGSSAGVVLGIGIQFGLPQLLADFLPFEASPRIRFATAGMGLLVGAWVSFLFALLPLLRVREIPPLAALRLEVEEAIGRAWFPRVVGGLLLGMSFFFLSAYQVSSFRVGLVIAVSLGTVLLVLAGISHALRWTARRLLPQNAPFIVRQGVAGLFRPGNQTGTVLTALGFGAFLMGAVLVAEAGLREGLSLDPAGGEPSLILFDVQSDQRERIESLLTEAGATTELIPLVPARLAELNGVSVGDLIAEDVIPGWMGRRVYRNTWRHSLAGTERLVAGAWDAAEDGAVVRDAVAEGLVRVSLEDELAVSLGLGVGDRMVWDVQGRPLPAVVSSLRAVDWASFQPNFYAVFEPSALEGAPSTWIGLIPPLPGGETETLQQALRGEAPNVSLLDVSAIRETVERVSNQVLRVLQALAGFATAGGFLVLFASLLAGRFRRRRESALLKTLGARSGTIRGVLIVEYLFLGLVGSAAGLLLGVGGGSLLLQQQFSAVPVIPWALLLAIWGALLLLTLAVGWSVSGPVLKETPMAALREAP